MLISDNPAKAKTAKKIVLLVLSNANILNFLDPTLFMCDNYSMAVQSNVLLLIVIFHPG